MNASVKNAASPESATSAISWKRRKLTALVVALAVLLLSALATHWLGVQRLAGVTLCLVLTLLFYACTRLVQTRGQLTTGLVAIVLPTIVALLCVTLGRMTPFFNRQIVLTHMSEAGIRFSARQPDEVDEWLRDREGYMLPTWLAFCIGEHCMTCLGEIAGDATDVSKLPLGRVPTASLRFIDLQITRKNSLTPELIDWLNELPPNGKELNITLTFHTIGEKDQEQLVRLKRPWQGELRLDKDNVPLRDLGSPQGLTVRGNRLSAEQAKVIARSAPDWLVLNSDLSPAVVQQFYGLDLRLEACMLDAETLQALARLDMPNFYMSSATFGDLSSVKSLDPKQEPMYLTLRGCQFQAEDDYIKVVELINCSHLSFVGGLSASQIDDLWGRCPRLEAVSQWEGGNWKEYSRPNASEANPIED
ncbi:MAG: hypothetical protein AAF394_04445 [Planctomycetota bacterium]